MRIIKFFVRLLLWLVVFFAGLLLLLVAFIKYNNSKPTKPPKRHPSIPKEAIWRGGHDGGSWIIINEGSSANVFKVKVYHEYNGDLLANGLFTISENCSDVVLSVADARRLMDCFNGKDICLSEIRCALVPIKK